MARPITPTPRLDMKSSRKFMERVEKDLKKPFGPVGTPKINKTIEMIMADATEKNNGE